MSIFNPHTYNDAAKVKTDHVNTCGWIINIIMEMLVHWEILPGYLGFSGEY